MKTVKFSLTIVCAVTLCLVSCKDDDRSSVYSWVSIATVENPNGSRYFFFTLDNGVRMWTSATDIPNYVPKDGQRILANYTILSDRKDTTYQHDVRLNAVYSILTKDIFHVTAATQDSIGDDPAGIDDIWIGGNCLNVEFVFGGHYETHFINLVSDSAKVYDDRKVHLEFRHNAHQDTEAYRQRHIASFRLKSLWKEGVDSLALVVHTHEYPSERRQYELVYHFSGQSSKKKAFEGDVTTGNVR
ncbi:MAG: NigD-like protein [Bacteroidales bacterium]|jgi:hypothetical protein|nr:NigD-like protein [Bacteroidales bacterium]